MKKTTNRSNIPSLAGKRLAAIGLLLALTVSALGGALPVGAVGAVSVAEGTDVALDTAYTSALSPAALLSFALGQPLTEAETQWLENEAGSSLPAELTLVYDGTVPHENVAISFSDAGSALVTAKPYTGGTLGTVWTPVSVTPEEGATYPLTAAGEALYTAELPIDVEALVTVTVQYEATLTASVEAINTLVNAAYDKGAALLAAWETYEQALADHTAATEAHNAYRAALQQYRVDLALYNAYLSEKKLYEERNAAYQTYLAELTAYEEKLAVYQAYLAEKADYDRAYADYLLFLNDIGSYEQKYRDYCDYLAKLETVRAQLALIDSCFVSDSQGHVLNNTLNGPTVSTVVDRQEELVAAGCSEQDIVNADAATAALIDLLDSYPQGGSEAEKYAYYIRYYTALRDNVTLLYNSLSRLYGNNVVPDILQMQGKKERYWQFVAQLYALSCALEDGIAFDVNWSIAEGKLTSLLEDCFILKDTNGAAPLAAYPAFMEEVVSPAEMKKPTPPTVVDPPVEPVKVTEPTPPAEVAKPVLPTVVAAPGKKPTQPLMTESESALLEAVRSGALTARPSLSEAVVYPLTLSVGKSASPLSQSVVSFYDYDRMTLLATVEMAAGTLLDWPALTPTRPAANGETYTFSGWMDEEGRAYKPEEDRVTPEGDRSFYAVYASEKASFTISWEIDGEITSEVYAYGEIPDYDGIPQKAEDTLYTYTFEGWSPAVTPVSGDKTYRAVFEPHVKSYEVQWVIGDNTEWEEYRAGEIPAYPTVPVLPMDGRYTYTFKGWSPEIGTLQGPAVYTAVFEATDLLPSMDDSARVSEENGMVVVTWTADTLWQAHISRVAAYAKEKGYGLILSADGYTLSFSSEETAALAADGAAWLRLRGTKGQGEALGAEIYRADLSAMNGTYRAHISITVPDGLQGLLTDQQGNILAAQTDGRLTVTLTTGERYHLHLGYAVSVSEGQGVYELSSTVAASGELVTVKVVPAPGYTVQRVLVSDASGHTKVCDAVGAGVYRFTMPEGDVLVEAELLPLTYTVTFRVGGTVISSEAYYYGDTPLCPADPVRESDEDYSYTFTGWSPAVTMVMGDAVYDAEFLAIPLNGQHVDENAIGIAELLLLGAASFVAVCGGVLVPYLLVTKRRSRQAAPTSERKG